MNNYQTLQIKKFIIKNQNSGQLQRSNSPVSIKLISSEDVESQIDQNQIVDNHLLHNLFPQIQIFRQDSSSTQQNGSNDSNNQSQLSSALNFSIRSISPQQKKKKYKKIIEYISQQEINLPEYQQVRFQSPNNFKKFQYLLEDTPSPKDFQKNINYDSKLLNMNLTNNISNLKNSYQKQQINQSKQSPRIFKNINNLNINDTYQETVTKNEFPNYASRINIHIFKKQFTKQLVKLNQISNLQV